jgi:hypothetical protein
VVATTGTVNDDLGAFTDFAVMIGRRVAVASTPRQPPGRAQAA